jgi:serine protease Do
VIAQLETSGKVTRGYIGVEAQQILPTMAKALGLPADGGALIAGVQPDSPAASAGLQPGDVVAAVDGQKVSNPRELAIDVSGHKPGEPAKLDVIRNGAHQTVDVKVAELPSDQQQAEGGGGSAEERGRVGLALAPLTPDMRSQLDLGREVKGAVVSQVQPGSPAEEAGIQQGDVIVGVGNKSVSSPEEATKAIRAAGKEHAVALRILRDGRSTFVAINLDRSNDEG